jgi:cysteine synthase B
MPGVAWKTGGWAASILETVGKTPMVRIGRLNPNPNVLLLAKLEGFNPSGSVKDRAALRMIEAAEQAGELSSGKTILEATSGNTGIALAMIGAVKGYQTVLVMSEGASLERRQAMEAYGAEVVLTPAAQGTDGAISMARKMAAESPEKYFMPDQFSNHANPLAHYEKTAEEMLEQAGGRVDAFVASIGTGGTLMGVSRFLKARCPAARVIGVEPMKGHKLQGMKNLEESEVPSIFERERLDEKLHVSDSDAIRTMQKLAKTEGILAGMSSGAALFAAIGQVKKMESGIVVALLPDRGERYLSTGLFASKTHGV